MPQAEYEVCEDFSSTTTSSSRPAAFAVRSAWWAALMPAASAPTTTTRSRIGPPPTPQATTRVAPGTDATRCLTPAFAEFRPGSRDFHRGQRVRADPRMHGDGGGSAGVQGSGRAELGDGEDRVAAGERLVGEAGALLA